MSIYPRTDPAATRYTERLRTERDEARRVARALLDRAKAAERQIARLQAAHAAEVERLRAEIAALTGQPRGIEWDIRVRVDAAALTDAERAGWTIQSLTLHPHAPLVSVALRRDRTQPPPPVKARTKTGAHPVVELPQPETDAEDTPDTLAARAVEIEARLPERQCQMLRQIVAGMPVTKRDAVVRKALKEAGLITVPRGAAWDGMTATALGVAVTQADATRRANQGAA